MNHRIEKSILINSDPSTIWKTLTVPELVQQWMGEPEMGIEIHTDWKVNSPIIIRGFHHIKFENRGTVLQFEPCKTLKYSHLSSVSRLVDKADNYSIIGFVLTPLENQTLLSLTIENFPTDTIFKHLQFYWNTTIHKIKYFIENNLNTDTNNQHLREQGFCTK
jgi:uncharacterized protein YndB with AHSA1/START domain